MTISRNFTLLTLFALTSITLTGCLNNSTKMENIANGINFSAAEYFEYSNSLPIPAFGLFTNDNTSCANNLIYNRIYMSGTELEIEIEGYNKSGSCMGDPAPATGLVPIYLENGEYDLKLTYKDDTDLYSLVLTDSTIRVSPAGAAVFSTPNDELYWRYPKNSFAVLAGTHTDSLALYTQVFDSLETNFNLTEFIFPDSGATPYPDSLNGYDVNYPTRFFKYTQDEDMVDAGNFIQRFGRTNISNFAENRFVLFDWRNIIFSTD